MGPYPLPVRFQTSGNGHHLRKRDQVPIGPTVAVLDGEYPQPLAGVLLEIAAELGQFPAAWRAPGRPVVQDNDLSPHFGEIDLLPVEGVDAERRRRLADLGARLGLPG